ncbi:MAG: T9SS type A sorting domain-containing protein [Carboxylicivirga sp.]|jgi:hypothetical protein|nr:T9SS type A sorting domain-containing protein [Carboxylicivirga sp.]
MRIIYKCLLIQVLILFNYSAKADTTEWGAAGQDYTLSSNHTIASGDTVVVLGNFFDSNTKQIIVSSGAIMIVHGNMKLRNANSNISGDVVVLGDVDLKNTDMDDSGNLIVVGALTNSSGNVNGVLGNVYLLDPEANEGISINLPNDPLYIDDLLDDADDKHLVNLIMSNVGHAGTTYNWDGSESTDWNSPDNWSDNQVPGALDVLVIDNVTNLPVCPSVLTVQDITIRPDAQMAVAPGSQITVMGDITIEAGGEFIVQNSNTNPTSFLVYGSVSGDITFEWNYNNERWWFIGHPISDATMADYNEILTTNNDTNDYALYDYQDPDVFAKISETAYDFSAYSPIKGYLFKVKDDNTPLTLEGTINNNAVYSKTLQTDWQIIANPYPAYYQLPTESGTGTDFDHTTGDVYVTVSTSNSDKVFHTYNTLLGIGSPAEFKGAIAPGQGFYVQTYSAGDVTMRAEHRMHSITTQLKSVSKLNEEDILRLKLKNEHGLIDEAVITFHENGQAGFTKLDSEQRFNQNLVSYLYSVIDGHKTVINVLPELDDDFSQKLGIRAQTGEHEFYIEGIDDLTLDYELILEDKFTGKETIMTTGKLYKFDSAEGSFDDRFVLHLKQAEATSVDKELHEETSINVKDDNILSVKCAWQEEVKKLSVYSLKGAMLLKETFTGQLFNQALQLPTGLYIVKLEGGKKSYQKKIILK